LVRQVFGRGGILVQITQDVDHRGL
jgi:hypothetical protein